MTRVKILVAAFSATLGAACFAQVVEERLADDVVRFHADATAQSNAVPSLALQQPLPSLGGAPAGFGVMPTFSTVTGNPAVEVDFADGTDFYGTGMASGGLRRNGRFTSQWTYDAYGYADYSEELYNAHPWVLAVRQDGSAVGLLADTTYRCDIDLSGDNGTTARFVGYGPSTPLIVIEKGSPQDVLMALGELTGTMPMPALWTLGYHQSRYSYFTDAEVLSVANEFRTRQIPLDSIWIDIDYKDSFRAFTFNPAAFPDPAQLVDDLDAINVNLTAILDAHTHRLPGFTPY
ncbi:MAG: TIM-barrel domain-containing protein, partial [Planctomycetota bacterium]